MQMGKIFAGKELGQFCENEERVEEKRPQWKKVIFRERD